MTTREYRFGNGDVARIEYPEVKYDECCDLTREGAIEIKFYEVERGIPACRGGVKITRLPDCPGAGISHALWTHTSSRGTQYPPTWRKLVFDACREDLNLGILLATWNDGNTAQKRSAADLGWSTLDNFVNPWTKNKLHLGVKHL